MEIIRPTEDFCIKELFKVEMILKYFLSAVLDISVEDIQSVRLLNPFLSRRGKKEKQGILDVLAQLYDRTKINIEMQIAKSAFWDKRVLFYVSKVYTDDFEMGEKYQKLKNVVHIALLGFDLTEGETYHHVYRLRDGEGNKFSDAFEIHMIELHKTLKGNDSLNDWIRFFNIRTREELDMIETKNLGVLAAIEELKKINLSKRMRKLREIRGMERSDRDARETYVREEGEKTGMVRGIEQERTRRIVAFINSCRSRNMSREDVVSMLQDIFTLSGSAAEEYISDYWK